MARLTRARRSVNQMIVDRLQGAGWQTTARGRFTGIADLTYDNGQMSLYVGYRYRIATIGLTLTDTRSRKSGRLAIEFGDQLEQLEQLLRVIVAWQAKVSPANFRDMLEDIVHVCPETYRIEGADGEIRTKVEPSHPAAPPP